MVDVFIGLCLNYAYNELIIRVIGYLLLEVIEYIFLAQFGPDGICPEHFHYRRGYCVVFGTLKEF